MDKYMTFLRFLFLFLGVFTLLFATVYEDAEDKQTSRWIKMDTHTQSHVDNIMDRQKASRIISFQGEGTRSMYALKTKKMNKKLWLSWEMNYREDFVIMVIVETNKGKRHLIYTPGSKDSYMQYGLGETAKDGKWHTYRRNLAKDLSYFDNRLKIKKMLRFVIRGSGSIDNILVPKNHEKKREQAKSKKSNKKNNSSKKNSKPKLKTKGDHTPVIKLEGENTVFIKKGERYVEPGVTAHDEEDGEINVVSMEKINIHKDGKYSIIYMATDLDGNAASDRRYVIVGKGKKEPREKIVLKEKEEKKSEPEDLDIDKEQKKYEMEVWERELELREQALREEINQLKGAK